MAAELNTSVQLGQSGKPWWAPQENDDWLKIGSLALAVRQQSARETQAKIAMDQTQKQIDFQGQRIQSEAAMNDLRMRQVQLENQDAVNIAAWQQESETDPSKPAPQVNTINGANIVSRLQTLRAENQARKQLDANYNEVLSEVPTAYGELNQYKRYSPEWNQVLETHLGAVRESKRMREDEAMRSKVDATAEAYRRKWGIGEAATEQFITDPATGRISGQLFQGPRGGLHVISFKDTGAEQRKSLVTQLSRREAGMRTQIAKSYDDEEKADLNRQLADVVSALDELNRASTSGNKASPKVTVTPANETGMAGPSNTAFTVPQSAQPAANTPSALKQIKGDADYDTLSSGEHFLDPDGKERIKP